MFAFSSRAGMTSIEQSEKGRIYLSVPSVIYLVPPPSPHVLTLQVMKIILQIDLCQNLLVMDFGWGRRKIMR